MTSSSHEKYVTSNVSPLRDINRFSENFMFRFAEIFVLTASSCLKKRDENRNPHFLAQKTLVEIRRWKIYCVFGSHAVFISIFSRSLSKKSSTFCLERFHRSPVVNVWGEIDFYEKLYQNHRNGKQGIYQYIQKWSSRGWFIHLHDHRPSLIPWLIPKWKMKV